jgi:hypothetical protein
MRTTGLYFFLVDVTYPTWSNNKTNLTAATPVGRLVYFNITLNDTNPGNYTLSWYNGTAWSNTSWASYTNGQEISVVKNITADLGYINWTWYFNDSANNRNQTDIWSVNLSIDNTAPNTTSVILNSSSGTNYSDEDLKCYANITDSDGGSVYANYTWYNNSIAFLSGQSTAFTQNTLSLIAALGNRNTTKGQNWTCSVQAYDNVAYEGHWTNSTQLTILNKAPNVTALISPTSPTNSDNLQGFCNSTEADNDTVIYYYVWYRNNITNESGNTSFIQSNILANINNISEASTESGDNWTLSCLAFDGTINSTVWQNYSVKIGNTPPNTTSVILNSSSGTNYTDEDLNCYANISDVESAEVYANYTWYNNSVQFLSGQAGPFTQGTTNLIAALGNRNTTKGENWTCSIKAYDLSDYETDWNNNTLKILNKAPTTLSARISPTSPSTTDNLQGFCNSTDSDEDTIIYHYIWYRNNITNATGNSSYNSQGIEYNVYNISSIYTESGDNWTLSCLAFDGTINSTVWQNYSVRIGNTAPNTTRVILNSSSGTNYSDEDLKCYANITDSDGGSVYANYTWYNNSIAFLSGQSSAFTQNTVSLVATLGNKNTTKGENWTCSVKAYDGTDYEDDTTNATQLTILNKAPAVSARIYPLSPATSDNLQGFCNSTEADNDTVIYYYVWYRNNITNESGNTSYQTANIEINVKNISEASTEWGDNWTLSCLAFDGTLNSTSWNNFSVDIGNTAPNTTQVTINSVSGTNYTDENIRCYANIADADGNPVYANYTWYNNSVQFLSGQAGPFTQGTTNLIATLGNRNTTKGENWTCSVKAYDLTYYEEDWNNATLTVRNKPPTNVSARISPINPTTSDKLVGYCNAIDADNDTLIYFYAWYRNSTLNITGNTSYYPQNAEINIYNISEESTETADIWTLSCLAFDGILNSTEANNVSVIIGNTAPNISSFNMSDDSNTTEGYQIDPIVASSKTFYAWFNVTDPDGMLDINSAWIKIMDAGGSESNPTYSNYSLQSVSCSSNSCLYNGSLLIRYYDTAGTWNITVYANDTSGNQISYSANFTVTPLVGFSLQNSPVNFGNINPNTANQQATSPIIILNQGNQPLGMNMTAGGNLTGLSDPSYQIPIQNINYANESGFTSSYNLTTQPGTLTNNLTVNNNLSLYFRITTPQIKAQHYSSNLTFQTTS